MSLSGGEHGCGEALKQPRAGGAPPEWWYLGVGACGVCAQLGAGRHTGPVG